MTTEARKLLLSGRLFKAKPTPTLEQVDEEYQTALLAKARAAHFLAQARLRFQEAERLVEKTKEALVEFTGDTN